MIAAMPADLRLLRLVVVFFLRVDARRVVLALDFERVVFLRAFVAAFFLRFTMLIFSLSIYFGDQSCGLPNFLNHVHNFNYIFF